MYLPKTMAYVLSFQLCKKNFAIKANKMVMIHLQRDLLDGNIQLNLRSSLFKSYIMLSPKINDSFGFVQVHIGKISLALFPVISQQ